MAKKYRKWKHGDVVDGGEGKILIGIPRERIYIPRFVDNRDTILYEVTTAGRGGGYFQAEGHRVDRNRDRIVEYFLEHEEKPEWLLMLDSDMEHPTSIPLRLVKHKKPIIGGLYFHRGETHDPFVFREDGYRNDSYGRRTMRWAPLRDEVFDFLEANRVPLRDGSVTIDEAIGEPIIKCDAVATGSMMIHREVLELFDPPVFEYHSGGNSEDLVFCYEAKHKHGVPIFCDLSTISGHYSWVPMGQAQFRTLYVARGFNLTMFSKREAAEWVAATFQIPNDEAVDRIEKGNAHVVADYWKAKNPQTPEEVDAFYRDPYTGQLYVIELLHWNFSGPFNDIRKPLSAWRDGNVLELGAGIGSVALQMMVQRNDVVAAEPNEFLREFIAYRHRWLTEQMAGKPGELFIVDKEWTKAQDEQFGLVIAIDVFEHVPEEELKQMLKDIQRVLQVGGTLYYHANWKQQDLYPMHYDYSDKWNEWLMESGFYQTGPLTAVRVK